MEVLVASTNVFRRELSAYLLAEAGYRVRECRDNDALLQEVADLPPDLLLVDQQMLQPATSAPLRSLAQEHNVPLLLLVTRSALPPSEHYVTWPYQAADLLERVRALHGGSDFPSG